MNELNEIFLKNWVLIVIIGNFFIALSNVISKVMVSGSISKPLEPTPYTFYSGLAGPVIFMTGVILNIWFDFLRTGFWQIGNGIIAGVFLILGLWPFYKALAENEASRVSIIYFGGIPLTTFLLKFIFFGERLEGYRLLAFACLVSSGVLVSFRHYKNGKFVLKDAFLPLISAFSIASGLVLLDLTFKLQKFPKELGWKAFLAGLTWLGVGYFIASLILFFWPGQKNKIVSTKQYTTKTNVWGFLVEKAVGIFGSSIMIKYAISLVGATLVNAFEGLKQFFVLILAGILSYWRPDILKEELKGAVLWEKILAAFLVLFGIFLLIYKG